MSKPPIKIDESNPAVQAVREDAELLREAIRNAPEREVEKIDHTPNEEQVKHFELLYHILTQKNPR